MERRLPGLEPILTTDVWIRPVLPGKDYNLIDLVKNKPNKVLKYNTVRMLVNLIREYLLERAEIVYIDIKDNLSENADNFNIYKADLFIPHHKEHLCPGARFIIDYSKITIRKLDFEDGQYQRELMGDDFIEFLIEKNIDITND
ncbi:hypothetical protein J4440_03040 [Candidatus Woesearchaeota archaeon]|nr:hypothetical protein [Candidatus Woesearchaeota archaeon]